MRFLICTQVMDQNHPILGFFHRWVEEFAKHCETVHVVCLEEGVHHLPENVRVHSLGKESGVSRLKYLWRFYRYSWRLRREYDNVFVHMNQVYAILGAPLWRWQGKLVGLWYMHGSVPPSLRVAERCVNIVFSGSAESFRLPSQKLIITGHGIDTEHFAPRTVEKDIDLITVGRIAPSKNLEAVLVLLKEIQKTLPVSLTIVGEPTTEAETAYQKQLMATIVAEGQRESVHWYGKTTQAALPHLLCRAKLFIHTATNGSLDKAILEAMACGVPVLSTAKDIAPPPVYRAMGEGVTAMAQQALEVLQSDRSLHHEGRAYVIEHHSVVSLIPKIIAAYALRETGR